MKFYVSLSVLVAVVVLVECTHTFYGSNTFGNLVYHKDAKFSANMFRKRVENITYVLPSNIGYGKSIQVIF